MLGVGLVAPLEVLVLAAPKIFVLVFVPVPEPPGGLKNDMMVVEDKVPRTDALCSVNQLHEVAMPFHLMSTNSNTIPLSH